VRDLANHALRFHRRLVLDQLAPAVWECAAARGLSPEDLQVACPDSSVSSTSCSRVSVRTPSDGVPGQQPRRRTYADDELALGSGRDVRAEHVGVALGAPIAMRSAPATFSFAAARATPSRWAHITVAGDLNGEYFVDEVLDDGRVGVVIRPDTSARAIGRRHGLSRSPGKSGSSTQRGERGAAAGARQPRRLGGDARGRSAPSTTGGAAAQRSPPRNSRLKRRSGK
jgi:hypothetical protein